MTAATRHLDQLAGFAGIQTSYWDWKGNQRHASPEALLHILRELGVEIDAPEQSAEVLTRLQRDEWARPLDPTAVAWDGEPTNIGLRLPAEASGHWRATVSFEDGGQRSYEGALEQLAVTDSAELGGRRFVRRSIGLDAVGLGYHRVRVETAGATAELLLIAAPRIAHDPPGPGAERRWGVFAPLYALRARGGSGTGSIAELEALARHVRSLGGSFVGTLPLLASFLDEPFEPSPYSPVSRLYWNELYLDLASAPGIEACPAARGRLEATAHAAEARALRALELVDYRRQMALQRSVLEPLAEGAWSGALRGELEAFLRDRPDTDTYARFRAAVEKTGTVWLEWEPRQRGGELREGDYDPAAWRYHVYAQLAMHRQLGRLEGADCAGLYLDLPVGVNRIGYDVWRDTGSFALGASAGAPPDELFTGGQNWGLPPLHPRRARERGYAYFRDCVRAHLKHADMLRIDHVMGLHRLFWVPEGAPATEGVYVRYPSDDLYAVLCLESRRHRCALVGEDLGTVPDEVRPAMDAHGIHRLFVVQFAVPGEIGHDPGAPPREAVASLNTHDVPTLAGYWAGQEIDQRVELGLLDDEQAADERFARGRTRLALQDFARRRLGVPEADLPVVLQALHDFLAASDAQMVLVNLEDLWLEEQPQNVPGTGWERPNWRRAMQRSLEDIVSDADLAAALGRVDERRRG